MAINMETAINNMYALKNRGITYSMTGSRTGADGTGDCSGTVYDSLRKAGASNAGWVLNTDSMHNWLLQNSFDCIATNKEWTAKRGDVVIFGPKGASGGSNGHVVIFISNTQVIHCTYKSATANGVYVDNEAAGCPYSMGWYVYRLKSSVSLPPKNIAMAFSKKGINYESHVRNVGWMNNVADGALSGSVGYNLPMEALKITFGNNHIDGSVQYRVHMRTKGWGPWVNNGSVAGTTGQVLPLEAFEVKLTGQAASYYDIEYQAHVKTNGWMPVVKNGQTAGTTGKALDMQAMKITLKRKPIVQGSKTVPSTGLSYRSHLGTEGWLGYVKEGEVSGTTGLNIQMEKLEVFYNGSNKDLEIDSHIKNDGWVKNSGGTVGENKWIEAFRIRAKGDLAKNYNIEYRVHSTNKGWMAWVRNGEQAGTTGQKLQVQAVQIRLVKK